MLMNHKEKVKEARKMSGWQKNHFLSPEWLEKKLQIENKVKKMIERQKIAAEFNKKESKI